MKDVIGSLSHAARLGKADAWSKYRKLLAGGQGDDADKAALQAAMTTLGLSADDVHRDYNAMQQATAMAGEITQAQAAVKTAADGIASLEAFISKAETALAARDDETAKIIATYRAEAETIREAIDRAHGLVSRATRETWPRLQQMKVAHQQLLEDVHLAPKESLHAAENVVRPTSKRLGI